MNAPKYVDRRLDAIEKEIAQETTLGLLLAPYRQVTEIDRRSLRVNGKEIVEQEMSDGTFRVFVDGMKTSWDYMRCIRWAGGLK